MGDGYIILTMMMVPEMYTCQNVLNFILYICVNLLYSNYTSIKLLNKSSGRDSC